LFGTWLTKAHSRKLIIPEEFDKLINDIEVLGKRLNNYIKSIGNVSEPFEEYGSTASNDE